MRMCGVRVASFSYSRILVYAYILAYARAQHLINTRKRVWTCLRAFFHIRSYADVTHQSCAYFSAACSCMVLSEGAQIYYTPVFLSVWSEDANQGVLPSFRLVAYSADGKLALQHVWTAHEISLCACLCVHISAPRECINRPVLISVAWIALCAEEASGWNYRKTGKFTAFVFYQFFALARTRTATTLALNLRSAINRPLITRSIQLSCFRFLCCRFGFGFVRTGRLPSAKSGFLCFSCWAKNSSVRTMDQFARLCCAVNGNTGKNFFPLLRFLATRWATPTCFSFNYSLRRFIYQTDFQTYLKRVFIGVLAFYPKLFPDPISTGILC